MQDIFGNDNNFKELLKNSLSIPRLGKYLNEGKGDLTHALEIYRWNARLSQSLYIYVQAWEVCLRNKLSEFLTWKYNATWPYDPRFTRNLNRNDNTRVRDCISRQESDRKMQPVPTSAIVADLSAGFWVSQLSYEIPYGWQYITPPKSSHMKTGSMRELHARCATTFWKSETG